MGRSFDFSIDMHGGRIYEAAKRLGASPQEILDFSANINPYGPPASALHAFTQSNLGAYPCNANFIEAAAAKVGLSPANIVVGNGTAGLIFAAVRAIQPRRALLIEPAFSEYRRALQSVGAEIIEFPVFEKDGFFPDFSQLRRTLAAERCDFLILNSPHNPTGVIYPKEIVLATLHDILKLGVFVFLDEAFIDYAPGSSALPCALAYQNVFIIRSLTKFYAMPGLRIGYGVCNREMVKKLRAQIEAWPVSSPALDAACAALADDGYDLRTREWNYEARESLRMKLIELGFEALPSSANFLLVPLPSEIGEDLSAWLEERRVLIRRCNNFVGLGDQFIRLAVRTPEENATIINFLHAWKNVR